MTREKLVRRYGLAILVLLLPIVFWAAGVAKILLGKSNESFHFLTRGWIAMGIAVAIIAATPYATMLLLTLRDRRWTAGKNSVSGRSAERVEGDGPS